MLLFNRIAFVGLSCLLLCGSLVSADDLRRSNSNERSFREFSGVNQARSFDGVLWEKAIGWERNDVHWSACEPQQGKWNQEYIEGVGRKVLELRKKGITYLPVLLYNTGWSYDRSARTLVWGNKRWKIKPLKEDGKFEVTIEEKQLNGKWKQVSNHQQPGDDKWPIAPQHVQDWENYIRRVVKFLRAEPYNVEYFQIWNEAYPTSGFWFGNLDDYMTRVHLPAAKIIHELGGKVVYGGWPCCGSLEDFVAMLDRHKAWETVDVLDVHYFPVSSFEYLYRAAKKRGYDNIGIWQTELGFTADMGFVSNSYPRFLYWCLKHDWKNADRYKLMYFAYWAPNDTKAYGYNCSFYSGDDLSGHGISLQTLGEILQGDGLKLYPHVTTQPRLRPEMNETLSSLEGFEVGNKIVLAIHLAENNSAKIFTDWNGNLNSMHLDADEPIVKVYLPCLRVEDIAKVERCDIANQRRDITQTIGPDSENKGLVLKVPLRDNEKSPAYKMNNESKNCRTFYVIIEKVDSTAKLAAENK